MNAIQNKFFRIIWTIVLCFIVNLAIGQVSTTKEKVEKLAKKNLTYFWNGRGCPSTFENIKSKYGFKIKCIGCIATGQIKRHNKRIIRKINKVYGKNWFEENKTSFY
jgi:hypothetical protein